MSSKAVLSWLPALTFAALLSVGMILPSMLPAKDIEAQNKAMVGKTSNFPIITLGDWKDSSQDVRYGFLIGFATAVEMEKEWQGPTPLPLEQSLNNSWMKGLDGLTFKQISDNITRHIEANPQKKNRPLVEYMWNNFAQPKVTERVSKKKYLQGRDIRQERRAAVYAQ